MGIYAVNSPIDFVIHSVINLPVSPQTSASGQGELYQWNGTVGLSLFGAVTNTADL